jgi:lambda family phage portal protein
MALHADQSSTSTAASPRAVQAVDLAAAPFKPSRLLLDFKATQEQRRRHAAAEAESARVIASMRHLSVRRPRAAAAPAPSSASSPAFPVVSGERSFGAAATDRLTGAWTAINTGINADLEAALSTLRARSRDWCVNTDQGARYLELCADNIVGPHPPRLQVRATLADGKTADTVANTAIEKAWAAWCRAGTCETTGQMSFGALCRSVVQAAARDGEFLARRIRNRALPFGFRLQLLEVDRIDSSLNTSTGTSGNVIRMGVEIDPLGAKAALHLYNRHPGDLGAGLAPRAASDRVPASELLHGFVLKRPEQVRGYPWGAPVLRRANTLAKYEGYALEAAKYGAAKMGFYTTDPNAVNGSDVTWETMRDATGELSQEVDAGLLEALPPGVSFQAFDPKYPVEAFGSFVTEYKRDIAAGLNVAHHNLSGNMAGVNYSSARIAELSERRSWRALQQWFIDVFVMPVFTDWLTMALLTRSIMLPSGAALPADVAPKFLAAAAFQPPGWAWVDPEKDIKAAALAMSYDVRSLRDITDEQGGDLEDTLRDKAALIEQYTQLGLPLPAWLQGGAALAALAGEPAQAPAPAAPAADDDVEDEDTPEDTPE